MNIIAPAAPIDALVGLTRLSSLMYRSTAGILSSDEKRASSC